ncbi:unnamed protein product [Amoebophrya sp. A120]|nr:unnamed protein product [Amoebophrya sp. A120]
MEKRIVQQCEQKINESEKRTMQHLDEKLAGREDEKYNLAKMNAVMQRSGQNFAAQCQKMNDDNNKKFDHIVQNLRGLANNLGDVKHGQVELMKQAQMKQKHERQGRVDDSFHADVVQRKILDGLGDLLQPVVQASVAKGLQSIRASGDKGSVKDREPPRKQKVRYSSTNHTSARREGECRSDRRPICRCNTCTMVLQWPENERTMQCGRCGARECESCRKKYTALKIKAFQTEEDFAGAGVDAGIHVCHHCSRDVIESKNTMEPRCASIPQSPRSKMVDNGNTAPGSEPKTFRMTPADQSSSSALQRSGVQRVPDRQPQGHDPGDWSSSESAGLEFFPPSSSNESESQDERQDEVILKRQRSSQPHRPTKNVTRSDRDPRPPSSDRVAEEALRKVEDKPELNATVFRESSSCVSTKEEHGNTKRTEWVLTRSLAHCQHTISDRFSSGVNGGPGRPLVDVIHELIDGTQKATDFPRLQVVEFVPKDPISASDSHSPTVLVTLDNRRTHCFKMAGIEWIEVDIVSTSSSEFWKNGFDKFTRNKEFRYEGKEAKWGRGQLWHDIAVLPSYPHEGADTCPWATSNQTSYPKPEGECRCYYCCDGRARGKPYTHWPGAEGGTNYPDNNCCSAVDSCCQKSAQQGGQNYPDLVEQMESRDRASKWYDQNDEANKSE